MSDLSNESFPTLFNMYWPTTGLSKSISGIDRTALRTEYEGLKRRAPRRSCYFVGHGGKVPRPSNRFEEHLAIALCRTKSLRGLRSGELRLLDYQFPLKAQQSDRIGKVDLLGVTSQGRLAVIELKVKPKKEKMRGDSPPLALMEGLRYAAVVDANLETIATEALVRFGLKVAKERPIVLILAPRAWWRGWLELEGSTRKASGSWEPEFVKFAHDVEERLGIGVECAELDIDRTDIVYGPNGNKPQIDRVPELYPVRLG